MPKDCQLLPPHSQELLRAARSGRLYKRPAPAEEEEVEVEGAEKPEKKEEPAAAGFAVKIWKQIPRNIEGASVSHLAKRHKNTVTLPSKAVAAQITGPTVTRATVRRIDAAGNPYDQTITLTEGQEVQGEIIATTVVPVPSVPNGVATPQQQTPVKRRPPPPKRKAKGPGRGRKKGKLPLPPSSRPAQEGADPQTATDAKPESQGPDVSAFQPNLVGRGQPLTSAQGVKTEDNDDSMNQDSEVADTSVVQSDDEEGDEAEADEGEEGEGERAEGDEVRDETSMMDTSIDQEQREDADLVMLDIDVPAPTQPVTEEQEEKQPGLGDGQTNNLSPHPGDASSLAQPMHLAAQRHEGSPLKNVVLPSPTEPSPIISPTAQSSRAAEISEARMSTVAVQETSQSGEATTETFLTETTVAGNATDVPVDLAVDKPSVPSAALSPLLHSSHGDLDIGVADDADVPEAVGGEAHNVPAEVQPVEPLPEVAPTEAVEESEPKQKTPSPAPAVQEVEAEAAAPLATDALPPTDQENDAPAEQPTTSEPQVSPQEKSDNTPAIVAGEDDGMDLLGGLERELDRQAADPSEDTTPAENVIPAVEQQAEPLSETKETTDNGPVPAVPTGEQSPQKSESLGLEGGDKSNSSLAIPVEDQTAERSENTDLESGDKTAGA